MDKHHLRKSADRKGQISRRGLSGERKERAPELCFVICRFSQVVFIHRVQLHAQSLFLFPIIFGIDSVIDGSSLNLGTVSHPKFN